MNDRHLDDRHLNEATVRRLDDLDVFEILALLRDPACLSRAEQRQLMVLAADKLEFSCHALAELLIEAEEALHTPPATQH